MKTTVPMNNLKLQYKNLKNEINSAVLSVLGKQNCILGEEVKSLEKRIAAYIGVPYAVGVSSGTDALICAFMALKIGWGDEVITTPYTFFATATAILRVGARPVFVDIEPDSFNIDPDKIEEKITQRTKAIVPVHLYGQSANMGKILAIAEKHKLAVVEDAAQAIGATYTFQEDANITGFCAGEEKCVGSFGDVGCFSFFPAKNLGGAGDGGIVTLKDKELYDRIMAIRTHGSTEKYYYHIVGGNFRLDTIHASILLVKMDYLDKWSKKRRQAAQIYRDLLQAKGLSQVKTPDEIYPRSVYNQFVLRVENRNALADYLKEEGVSSAVYYPVPVHLQKALTDGKADESMGYGPGDFPFSEEAAAFTLAIPMFPEITIEQQEYVVDQIEGFYVKHNKI